MFRYLMTIIMELHMSVSKVYKKFSLNFMYVTKVYKEFSLNFMYVTEVYKEFSLHFITYLP